MGKHAPARPRYPSALPDDQGALGAPLLPPATSGPRGGHLRQVDMRDVLTPLCSRNRGGCSWDLRPQDCLPTSTVSDDVALWRDAGTWATMGTVVRERTRVAAGREPTFSVAGLVSKAAKTTERK